MAAQGEGGGQLGWMQEPGEARHGWVWALKLPGTVAWTWG